MKSCFKLATMLASCLAFAHAFAQWPARWSNDPNDSMRDLAHKGVSMAVDHRGNIYCAGPVRMNSNLDPNPVYAFGVVSYTATGTQRWFALWQDASGHSAVPTGIATDWQGNSSGLRPLFGRPPNVLRVPLRAPAVF